MKMRGEDTPMATTGSVSNIAMQSRMSQGSATVPALAGSDHGSKGVAAPTLLSAPAPAPTPTLTPV